MSAAREIGRVVAERQALEAEQGLIGPPAPEGLPRAAVGRHHHRAAADPGGPAGDRGGAASLTALPRDRAAWGRLSRLITLGRRRAPKGSALIRVGDVLEHGAGMELLLHPPERPRTAGRGRCGG